MAERRRWIIDDEEGDEGVLDSKEEVLAVGRERELVTKGIGRCYCVCQRFENIGG